MPTESASGSAERGTATTWRRLAGLLAVATGGYALVGATGEMAMLLGERLMALCGVAAVGHGLALVAGAGGVVASLVGLRWEGQNRRDGRSR